MTVFQIDCTLHDYLEIACMFHYDVRVALQDGATVEGRAITTSTHPDKSEALELATDQGPISVMMEMITYLEVLTRNARFQRVDFTAVPSVKVN